MNLISFKEELKRASVQYAYAQEVFIIKMSTEEGGGGKAHYLTSSDGDAHCGYLLVEGCSLGDFWFDLYNGYWCSNDAETQEFLARPDVQEALNKWFDGVFVCLGHTSGNVNANEIWRKIISLQLYGDSSRSNEIIVMTQEENALLRDAARYAPPEDDAWEYVKPLSELVF